VYPDKEVSNKTTVHQLITKFRVDASVREGDFFLSSTVKPFCKFFLTNNKTLKQLVCLATLMSLKLTNIFVVRVTF
jgi:hypothetical protein